MSKCTHFQKIVKILTKLHLLVEKSKVVEDLDIDGYVSWWNKK